MRPTIPTIDYTQIPHTFSMTIPDKFRDEMGHMNVTWYTHLFSEAMGGLMTYLGLTMDYIEREKIGGAALEAHILYLAEVHIGDEVSVFSRIISRSDKRMHLLHILHNDTRKQESATYECILACFDLRTRRMSEIPKEIKDKIDAVAKSHGELPWAAPLCGVMAP